MSDTAPVGLLNVHRKVNDGFVEEPALLIYGGYANHRGEISLFGESTVYRLNLKNNSVQERPPLNSGAQERYDATQAGEVFKFANSSFRRLSSDQILDICASRVFRMMPRAL